MGTDSDVGYAADGEGPQRRVTCDGFRIARCAVTNAEFGRFVEATHYQTDAERYGWSFVFHLFVSPEVMQTVQGAPVDTPWWLKVPDACWRRPEGPDSDLAGRLDHPVTHVSWRDARMYCLWTGTRLPTEAEWECAARGGLENKAYPWGDSLTTGGRHRCNIWQGRFPDHNTAGDGYVGTAPVNSYEPNGFGLYNVAGNVWEWCQDWFSPNYHKVTKSVNPRYVVPTGRRSIRGGSFLCHRSYCHRYRVAARSSNTPTSSTSHCGFRVVEDLPRT